jgi:glycosyltransferase involved in cell wall biosynthesis
VTVVSGLEHGEVPGFLASCDILIIPRLSNRVNDISFPSKLPEYLAMGKPVVASRTSDSFRVIEDGVNGLLFTPGDKTGLKNILVNLIDFHLREEIGKNARQISTDKLCWEKQVEIFHTELLELVVSSLEGEKKVHDTNSI